MKKITCACILTLTLTLTGCSVLPTIFDEEDQVDRSADSITVGTHLTAPNTDERLTLFSNMDTLSSDGLYYASWTAGSAQPYENADGDTVDLYDAQLYLLVGEYNNAETALENMEIWLESGQSNYDVTDKENVTYGGQTYTMITYDFENTENPYARGISAFGVYENCSVCIELTCTEEYDEDLQEMLAAFLNGCTYQ